VQGESPCRGSGSVDELKGKGKKEEKENCRNLDAQQRDV
jgi:hypothetical protein